MQLNSVLRNVSHIPPFGEFGNPNDLPPQDIWSSLFLFCLHSDAGGRRRSGWCRLAGGIEGWLALRVYAIAKVVA
jgi:hypothetical protein